MNIPIYKAEAEAGLKDKIQASSSIAYETLAKPFTPNQSDLKKVESLSHPKLAKADENQWDLYWIDSVLVSVGWNKNDDVFDPGETWAAKNSPVHKQFNFMHNEKDIIGHMTASMVLSPDGKVLDDDNFIPEQYDIVVASVLYKHWSDETLQERMNKIVAGIPDGKWFVSMECLFRNFDYALISPNGEHKVLARNSESSFLTKHLRVYGGTGEYEGHKIGRLLRGFTFSGKGLVENPANPRSIIFTDVSPFDKVTSSQTINFSNNNNTEVKIMAELSTEVVSKLKDDLAKSEARSDKLEKKLDEMVAEARKAEKEKFEKQIAGLEVDVEDLDKKVKAKDEDIKEKDDTIAKLEKELKDAKSSMEEVQKKLSDSEAATAKANRVSVLVEAGVDSEEAKSIVEKWVNATDEQFEDVVNLHKSVVSAQDDKDKDKKNKDKERDEKTRSNSEVDKNEANADTDVDDAEEEEDAALASAASNEAEELQTAAASWIGGLLKSGYKTQE